LVPPPGRFLDDELLAEAFRQPLPGQARDDVGAAAGRNRNDHAHRAASDNRAPTRRMKNTDAAAVATQAADIDGAEISWPSLG